MSDTTARSGSPIRSIRAVIPAYNEQGNLAEVVQSTLEALHDVTPTYEVVVVDDGSTDGTHRVADECAAAHSNVTAIHHARRLGLGAAWRSGYAGAATQYTFFVDADKQYDPLELERIAHWGDAYDLIAGARVRRADGMRRRLLGLSFRLVVRWYLHVKARDATCSFLIIRTSLLQRMQLESNGAAIQAELRYRVQEMGARKREVGIHHFPRRRGTSSGARPRTILKAIAETVALKRRIAAEQRQRKLEVIAATEASEPPAGTAQPPDEKVDPPVAGVS